MDKRILVVDDSNSIRVMVKMIYKRAGHMVLEACDGNEAFTKLDQEKVDLVLLDHHMPGIDGLDVLKKIRSSDDYKTLPVYMITANDSEELKEEAAEANVNGFFVKPLDGKKLLEIIDSI